MIITTTKQLPKDWKLVRVSSLAELFRGINYTKDAASNNPFKGGLPILRGNNINGELNFEDLVYVPKELIKEEQLIKKDDIIFAMSSGSKHLVGKSAVAKNDFNGSYGAFCALLRINEEVNKKYVSYVFKGNSYRKLISEIAKGTNINNLKREHILDFELPLPPKPIQEAIVSKIEELFSELDKGIETLRLAQQQLKTYRQSVLKWAFEGKLTNENVKDDQLPNSWKWLKLEEVADKIFDGPFGSNLKSVDYIEDGVRVIRLENIGVLTFKDEYKTFVSNKKYLTIQKHTVGSGDIIFSSFIIGEIRVVILPKFIKKAINKADCFCIRVSPKKIDNNYLAYFLSTKNIYNQLMEEVHGATRPRINTAQLKSCLIPYCPIEEQHNIVQAIEGRLSVADKMEESITQSVQEAEALRQSILKKAFDGRLVN